MNQFVRLYDHQKQEEVLLNLGMVWKIEVTYAVPGTTAATTHVKTTLDRGRQSPDAERFYRIYVGSEDHLFSADPSSPVYQVIEDIYRNALRAD